MNEISSVVVRQQDSQLAMEELLREVDSTALRLGGTSLSPEPGSALARGLAAIAETMQADDTWVLLEQPTSPEALARAAVPTATVSETPLELPSDTAFTGAVLRRVRESRGLSVSKFCDRTRIAPRHLENIEADRYAHLPVTVYLRGMLLNLAQELGLDPAQVSRSYLELAKGTVSS